MQSKETKKFWKILFSIVMSVFAGLLIACNAQTSANSSTPSDSDEQVYVLNEPVLELNVGDTFSLSVLNLQSDARVEWRSLQSVIANVDGQGVVTALSPGKTQIIATVDEQTLTCVVKVDVQLNLLPTLELQGMQPQGGEYRLSLILGDEYNITPVLEMTGETLETTFTITSDSAAVTVENNTLRAVSEIEEAKITVSCTYQGETYSIDCYVCVEEVA